LGGSAGMLKVGRELLAERGGVLGVQVDLITGALEGEPDGLLGRPPVKSSSRTTLTFWAISTFPPSGRGCARRADSGIWLGYLAVSFW